MKEGWVRGVALGTLAGASAMALMAVMNRQAHRKVVKAVSGAAHRVANKANEIMK